MIDPTRDAGCRLAAVLQHHTPEPPKRLDGADIRLERHEGTTGRLAPHSYRIAAAAATVAALVVALAVTLVVSGRVSRRGDTPAVDTSSWVTYAADGWTILHPQQWRSYRVEDVGPFSSQIVAFSTKPVPDPCHSLLGVTACSGRPVVDLRAGGVVVFWATVDFPNANLLELAPGTATTIDGRRAKIGIQPADDVCRRSHGTRLVTVTIAADAGVDTMSACLAATGARLTALTAEVVASARSARLP